MLVRCLHSCRGLSSNGLLFSPILKYGNVSYTDIVLTPIAEAVRDANAKATDMGLHYVPPEATRSVVYMSLQGMRKGTWLA